MTDDRGQTPTTPFKARVTWSDGVVELRDPAVFGAGGEAQCERFVARAFRVQEIRSVVIERAQGTATLRFQQTADGPTGVLKRLAAAVRDEHGMDSQPLHVPRATRGSVCEYVRVAEVPATVLVIDRPGRLRLRVGALRGNPGLAQRVERLLETVPGVRRATAGSWRETLVIHYDEAILAPAQVRRLAENALTGPDVWSRTLAEPTPVSLGVANATLGLAAVGQFVVPALLPVSALLLVGTNLRIFRAAWLQILHKRCGLPVLYTAIVMTTLATGQFVSSALMTWFFRFWHRRYRRELATERHRLLDSCMPLPGLVRLIPSGSAEVLVEAERLAVGDLVAVSADESVPADGRVVVGEAVVDERSLRGLDGVSRKREGDTVLAGSVVISGDLRFVVERPVGQTRAEAIGRALVSSTSPVAGASAPTHQSEVFAERAVGPTLATAGLGLLVGDLMSVGAILRPDYATGPGLGVPLDILRDVSCCARRGLIVRDPAVFDRLNEVDLLVIDDHPALRRAGLEVSGVLQSSLDEAEILRYAASAFRYLDDPRAVALGHACLERRIHLLDLEPVDLGSGVTVVHGKHRIRVHSPARDSDGEATLNVEINGTIVGSVSFRRSGAPEAVRVVRRLRELGLPRVALVSDRPTAEVASLAATLGVNQLRCGLDTEGKAKYLRDCRAGGVKAAFVGDCRHNVEVAGEAYVAVSLLPDDTDMPLGPEAVQVFGERLDRLEVLWEVAKSHADRVRLDHAFVVGPNLLCVAGALLFGFTGLTVVLISNLGTYGVYSRASGELRALEHQDRKRLKLTKRHRQTV